MEATDWYQSKDLKNVKWVDGSSEQAGYTNIGTTASIVSSGANAGTVNLNADGTATSANTGESATSSVSGQTQIIAKNENNNFEGVPVYKMEGMAKGAGLTLPGIGIFVSSKSAKDVNLLRHEFGHVLQSNRTGKTSFYLFNAIPSLASATWSNISSTYDHHTFYTEKDANDESYQYFGAPRNWDRRRFPLKPSYDQNPVNPYIVPPNVYAPLFY
ncbi:hypothetical protein [Pedobacter cryoconitis]|uniref:hypothetical protein n=1 Tax=Pedobacter cryoconitis TaxID=188932 RepID=UPI0017A91F85|nr:hypothetical protein [Pedobacter cryoconitis]MBB5646546.1 hypothetical protein [Pedobacter cryoconitis]